MIRCHWNIKQYQMQLVEQSLNIFFVGQQISASYENQTKRKLDKPMQKTWTVVV